MGLRFRSSFIFTTTARIDTSTARLWRVLMATSDWPSWWLAVARCESPPAGPKRALPGGRWRVAWGLPLQLNVATVASEWPDWLTVRLQGDLRGQLTFAVQPACGPASEAQRGVDLTCRCELLGVLVGLWPWRMLLERRIRRLAQTLVHDLGQVLHCPARVLSHWQGSAWHG
jgi:uncharacterized protein YndB with AHSA1/START domain